MSKMIFWAILFVLAFILLAIFDAKDPNSFKNQCIAKGGEYTAGKGVSLCIKDGLIIDHK